jgi:cation diffusion facilitator family transporter
MAVRSPTVAELQQEKALRLIIVLDLLIVVPYLIVGLAAGELVMVAEVLRGGLLLFVIGVSLRTLKQAHRGQTIEYDYGIGKLERGLSAIVAVLLFFAAGFIILKAIGTRPEPPRSPFLAGLAVLLVCVNLVVNTAPLLPLWRSLRSQPSVIVLSQFRARLAKALGSLVVVGSVVIHMFSADPIKARVAESIGSIFVAGFMIVVAVSLFREALPDLLDRAIAEPMQLQINRTLATFFHDYDELIRVRTRRSGNIAHVEITLGFAQDKTVGELSGIITRMRDHLQEAIPNCDVVIVPGVSTTKP